MKLNPRQKEMEEKRGFFHVFCSNENSKHVGNVMHFLDSKWVKLQFAEVVTGWGRRFELWSENFSGKRLILNLNCLFNYYLWPTSDIYRLKILFEEKKILLFVPPAAKHTPWLQKKTVSSPDTPPPISRNSSQTGKNKQKISLMVRSITIFNLKKLFWFLLSWRSWNSIYKKWFFL